MKRIANPRAPARCKRGPVEGSHLLAALAAAVAIGLAAQSSVAGDEPVEPTGVLARADALALAMSHHPELVASSHEARAAEARTRQAGRLPNPELEVVVGEYDRNGEGLDSAEVEFGLSQSLELGRKRQWRKRMATVEAAMTDWEREGMQLAVRATTIQRFVDVLAAQQRLELARSTIEVAEQTSIAVAARVNAGREPPLQASKAAAELEMARIELEEVENELRAARRGLAAMWGSAEPQFASAEGALDSVRLALPSLDTARTRLALHPAWARWNAALEHHHAMLSAERVARVPDVDVMVGYTRFEEDGTDAFSFGLGIPLPLHDRNRDNIAAAQHDLARIRAKRKAAELALVGELLEVHAALDASRRRVEALRDRVVPAMEQAFEGAHTGYQQGKFGFLDMLDAQRSLFEARGALVDALANYHGRVADLERLTGTTMQELMMKEEENGR